MMKRMRIKYFQKNQLLHVVPPNLAFPHLELGVAETILKTTSIKGLVTSLGHPGSCMFQVQSGHHVESHTGGAVSSLGT